MIKVSEANLYNCEGFMFETELVDKLNSFFKHKNELGMTLKELAEIEPRNYSLTFGKDQEPIFTKSEIKK